MLTRLPRGLLQTLVTVKLSWCPELIIANPNELCSSLTLRLASVCHERLLCLTTGLRRLWIGASQRSLNIFLGPPQVLLLLPLLEVMDMGIQNHQQNPLVSLESLSLRGWPMLKSLPNQLQHLTALRELSIEDFDGLEVLLEWLGKLSSLQSPRLHNCRNLTSLPSLEAMNCLTNLQSLSIYWCPHLEERYKNRSFQECPEISRIPSIALPHGYDFDDYIIGD